MRESDKRRTQTQTHRQTYKRSKEHYKVELCFALLCLIDCVFLFFLFLTIFCSCFVLFWWSFFFFFFFLVLVAAWFRLPAANPNPTAIKTTIVTALHQFQLMRSSFVVWLSWCAVAAAAAADHDHQRAIQRAPMHDDDHHHHRLSFFLSSSWHQAKIAKFFLCQLQLLSFPPLQKLRKIPKRSNFFDRFFFFFFFRLEFIISYGNWMNEWLDGWMAGWLDE